jgi:hypothetical protein
VGWEIAVRENGLVNWSLKVSFKTELLMLCVMLWVML